MIEAAAEGGEDVGDAASVKPASESVAAAASADEVHIQHHELDTVILEEREDEDDVEHGEEAVRVHVLNNCVIYAEILTIANQ